MYFLNSLKSYKQVKIQNLWPWRSITPQWRRNFRMWWKGAPMMPGRKWEDFCVGGDRDLGKGREKERESGSVSQTWWNRQGVTSIKVLLLLLLSRFSRVRPNSVRPHRWQPTRLPRPWDSPGENTEVCCHFLLQCMKVKSESEVAQSCLTLRHPMDNSLPGSSVHGIFQVRYCSGVPSPSPEH